MTTDAILGVGVIGFVFSAAYITLTAWMALFDCLQAITRLANAVAEVVRRGK